MRLCVTKGWGYVESEVVLQKLSQTINTITGPKPCPSCGKKAQPQQKGHNLAVCPLCGYEASLTEWLTYHNEYEAQQWNDPDREPTGSTIKKRVVGEEVTWAIPAKRKMNFIMVFGLIWSVFMVVFSIGMIPAALKGEVEGNMPTWMIFPFIGVFWVVGLSLLFYGIYKSFARHVLLLTGGQLVYVKSLFNRKTKRVFAREEIVSVDLVSFYSQNYQPVYGVKISTGRKSLKFGTAMTEDEKSWLVSDLRRYLFPSTEVPAAERSYVMAGGAGATAGVMQGSDAGSENFAVRFAPPSNPALGIFMGLVFAGIGTGVWYWRHFMPGHEFNGIDWFMTLWSVLFGGAGYYLLIYTCYQIGRVVEVVGTMTQVKVYAVRGESRREKKSINRSEIKTVRLVSTNQQHESLKLQTETESVTVVMRQKGELTQGYQELRRHLSL